MSDTNPQPPTGFRSLVEQIQERSPERPIPVRRAAPRPASPRDAASVKPLAEMPTRLLSRRWL